MVRNQVHGSTNKVCEYGSNSRENLAKILRLLHWKFHEAKPSKIGTTSYAKRVTFIPNYTTTHAITHKNHIGIWYVANDTHITEGAKGQVLTNESTIDFYR